jgi:16S rRNA processing protein RimM
VADLAADQHWLHAGRVGRPHGLDGSFLVAEPNPQLLHAAGAVMIAGIEHVIDRRAGHDARMILGLQNCSDREAVEALRGQDLFVDRKYAPELENDEWWAEDLEGCAVRDGERAVGTVTRLLALPSCEVLEVERAGGGDALLVPLISDAVRLVDLKRKEIDIDLAFLGEE